jgi:hypothetical protein
MENHPITLELYLFEIQEKAILVRIIGSLKYRVIELYRNIVNEIKIIEGQLYGDRQGTHYFMFQ